MRYAVIIAGGSGTRLWPMSTRDQPKQLIPFLDGRSLLQIAMDRLKGLVPDTHIFICAGESHRKAILESISGIEQNRFYGEPMGRDTLNAVGLATADLGQHDPEAVVAIFTADHVIEPIDVFQKTIEQGFEVAESQPTALVTFGIQPTYAATGYGYLSLGEPINDAPGRRVLEFREKPDRERAEQYFKAGAQRYLWNSGMFVWRADTLMRSIKSFVPENFDGLDQLGKVYRTVEAQQAIAQIYPKLKKISVDFAVMEPASKDPEFQVVAVPMELSWLDVGSWPSFGKTQEKDGLGNSVTGCKSVMVDTADTLIASSDPDHLIATAGCEGLIVIHTPQATLVCRAEDAEKIKLVHQLVGEKIGMKWL